MRSRNRTVLDLPGLSALSALSNLPALSKMSSLPALLAASALLASPALGQAPGRGDEQPVRPGVAESFADRMMASDMNKDGKLSLDEMDAQFGQTLMDRADSNKDGFLTRVELVAMAKARIAGRQPGASEGDDEHGDEADEENSYHEAMEHAGGGLRGLRRSPMDATSRARDLVAVQAIQMGLLHAKLLVDTVEMSENAEKIYGSDSVGQHKAMRLALIKVFIKALELEYAIAEGNTEGAKEAYGAIREMRADAHDTFEPEEDEDHDHDDDDDDGGGEG